MQLSELIEKLNQLLERWGDIGVVIEWQEISKIEVRPDASPRKVNIIPEV